MLAEWLRRITDRAFAPYSVSAFAFAVGCVAVATCVRYALGWIHPGILPFTAHFPAVMIVAPAGRYAGGDRCDARCRSSRLAALFLPEGGTACGR